MNVFISQIYIEAGVSFPFSHMMQLWLSQYLSDRVAPTRGFEKNYGADFNLIIRVSARANTNATEVRGPTVFKKAKDVECTVLQPYDSIMASENGCRAAVTHLLGGVEEVCARAGVEISDGTVTTAQAVDHICSEPSMLNEPWPVRPPSAPQ